MEICIQTKITLTMGEFRGAGGGTLAIFSPMEVHQGLGPRSYALVLKDQGKHHRERGSVLPIQFTKSES